MKASRYLLGLLLAALCFQAYGETPPHKKKHTDCELYTGEQPPLAEADAQFLQSVVKIFKDRKRQDLIAMMDKDTQLIRRFGFSASGRGGNIRTNLEPEQIDRQFNIHLGKMTLPEYRTGEPVRHDEQLLSEFSFFDPKLDQPAIFLNHSVCEGARNGCDVVPNYGDIEKLIGGLLYCNHYHNSVFVFTDGIMLIDMHDGPGLPNGEALFFSRAPSGYRISALISFQ